MREWKSGDKLREKQRKSEEVADLEERLAAYYGPRLQAQALPLSSWQRLRARLGSRRSRFLRSWQAACWHGQRLPRWRRRSLSTPVQEAFARVAYEARVSYPASSVRCQYRFHTPVPLARPALFGRYKFSLTLSPGTERAIGPAGLDLLVGSGLARYLCIRNPRYVIVRLLLACIALLACVLLVLSWRQSWLFIGIPIVVVLLALVPWLAHLQKRAVAFRADRLVVLWLGRSRVCRGLRVLADTSRKARFERWGEPSLHERIDRICGTAAGVEDERLIVAR